MKKIILAYSGGLDTTCVIKWLKDKGFKVICFSANLGSEFSPSDLRKRAYQSGAEKIYIKDLRKEFLYHYVLPALKANACYEGKYLLSTALGRPLIAKHLVEVAKKEKADFVAHGCTGKGNDQVRLEVSVNILDPKLKIIAPLREWEMGSREEEIKYAKKNKLPVTSTKEKPYSIDKNIWGLSIEAGYLEDLSVEPPRNSYILLRPLKEIEDKEVRLEIEFKRGEPVSLNGKILSLVSLVEKLNVMGAKCGVGRSDLIEDRVVGIKSREIYEAPAAWILYTVHKELENLILDRETLFFKQRIALDYAWLIYQGLYFSRLKESLDVLVNKTQESISGIISLKLYKGNIIIMKRRSANSLYKKELATYGDKDKFDRNLAEGFIKLWGMPYGK
ncbi:MAG: argininosuccinate synthase [Candidatus Omnitrophica bacterium]|nr:argininosuccinate synthase [Candidatus Omnitrophota bacterium]